MAEGRLSDAQLVELKGRHPCDQVAAQWVTLRRAGRKMRGACPVCSDDKQSRKAARFECDAEGWVCAVCADGGDVIKLVQKVQGCDFRAAVAWLGGAADIDPAERERIERAAADKKKQRDAEAAVYREQERKTTYEIWRDGKAFAGSAGAAYLTARHLELPAGAKLRALASLAYFERIGEPSRTEAIHRAPAMLAPIVNAAGKFSGLHMTYLDPARPGRKLELQHPETGEALPAKKVRGSKAGGHIDLVPCADPRTLVIGEGIETVLSVWRAFVLAGRSLEGVAFWAAVDLGNLGGRALETVRHPTLKTAGNRAARVPGPAADLAASAIAIPDGVDSIIILGDGDSDRFLTECAVARAGVRFAKPGRKVLVAWAPAGQDFNDLAPDWPRILELVDQAVPPVVPSIDADASHNNQNKVARRKPRGLSASSPALPSSETSRAGTAKRSADLSVDAAAAPPPAAALSPPKKEPSSQTGANPNKPDGRRGAGRGVTQRRDRSGGDMTPEDLAALDLRLAFFPLTDLGNAERFRERFRGRLLWCAAIGWLYWDGRRWAREGADDRVKQAEHITVRAIQDEAAALVDSEQDKKLGTKNAGKANEEDVWLSDLLRQWGRASESNSKLVPITKHGAAYLSVQSTQLDADPFKLNVSNGTLTILKTLDGSPYVTCSDHDPRDLITKLVPVEYDPAAVCPQYDKFMGEVQPKTEMRRFLHQWKGLSLTGDVSEQRLCVFWGKGKNGKSVFEDVTAHVAGDYGETVPIETFLAEGRGRNAGQATPDLAVLPGVRLLRTSEPKRNAPLDEALIKLATGGEPIMARHLNRDYFKFYPQFKLTISGNYRPKIEGSDEGIWRRVILVPWTYTVPADKRDPRLAVKLKGEASGILNRLLEGLCDWLDHGLVLPEDVDQATAEYRSDSDPLGRFLAVCVKREPGGRVQATTLHELFVAWARSNSATEWSPRGLALAMKERGYHSTKSSVSFWLDIATVATVADFLDSHGKPLHQDERKPGDAEAVE